MAVLLSMTNGASGQGKPTGEPERLANGVPDFHQYEGEILRVVDADTLTIRIHLLPGLKYEVDVRQRGVDAPELRGTNSCEWEKTLAAEAKAAIERRFPVVLVNIQVLACLLAVNVDPTRFINRTKS